MRRLQARRRSAEGVRLPRRRGAIPRLQFLGALIAADGFERAAPALFDFKQVENESQRFPLGRDSREARLPWGMASFDKASLLRAARADPCPPRGDVSATPATVNRGWLENSCQPRHGFAADASHSQEKARPFLFRLVEGRTALPFVLRDPALGTQFVAPLGGRVKAKWPSESVVAFKDRASGRPGLPWLQRLCDPRSPGQNPRLSQMIYSRQTGTRD
jgi:hypothetical protein